MLHKEYIAVSLFGARKDELILKALARIYLKFDCITFKNGQFLIIQTYFYFITMLYRKLVAPSPDPHVLGS